MRSYVYLHGFASGPSSSKALYLRDRLAAQGVDLAIPALDEGDFKHLTLSRQLTVVEHAVQHKPAVLLGSSMGGYLAALYAHSHPEVERLVLMAPAFDFSARWAERVGPAQIELWRQTDKLEIFHYARRRMANVGYQLFEDAVQYPAYPAVSQPALVLHGLDDEIVSPDRSRRFCELNATAELHLFEAGHDLTDVLEPMWARIQPFLFS